MFLKAESFEHNGVTVTLPELSTLQRVEYLALVKQQAEQAELNSNQQVIVEDAIRTGVFMVAMSLWRSHPQKIKQPSIDETVKQVEQKVLTIWSAGAISHAKSVAYQLFGMYGLVVNDALDQAGDPGPAEPVSVGKCSAMS